ncbi:hypothetical protein P7K49_024092 [Saguinus oedipus]|uniref:Uncharacterized protein n=1 Tax=Saguinus oedipus TaxID=9490 RepID=A0ABQ9UNH2_SAGOE|nr:hypothetical protein P7K49_024092 [Saguinus oedipus]
MSGSFPAPAGRRALTHPPGPEQTFGLACQGLRVVALPSPTRLPKLTLQFLSAPDAHLYVEHSTAPSAPQGQHFASRPKKSESSSVQNTGPRKVPAAPGSQSVRRLPPSPPLPEAGVHRSPARVLHLPHSLPIPPDYETG